MIPYVGSPQRGEPTYETPYTKSQTPLNGPNNTRSIMANSPITDVIFDFCGVLLDWNTRACLEGRFPDEIVERICADDDPCGFFRYEDRMDTGEVYVNGKKADIRCIGDAVEKYGMCYVTENRKEEGLILPFDVRDNMTLTILRKLRGRGGKISNAKRREATAAMIRQMDIRTPSQETRVESLSGGNQQKVSIGKWLAAGCDILIIDEPTVGVDVGAKRQIHEIIWNLAKNEGKSIILISSDMTEMITLARRILVFRDFEITAEIQGLNDRAYGYAEVSEKIGAAMA